MRPTLALLVKTDFPALRRREVSTLQVNLGYRCNQSCVHCHVNAGPNRTEEMSAETIDEVIACLDREPRIATLDLTGGAPELNPHFRRLVVAARERGLNVIDRCNLTILEEPGQEDLAGFLAEQRVEVVASMPCYLEDNVDRQRGKGVFDASIRGLKRLNLPGYGRPGSGLRLNLVFNPQGPVLPPPQASLEQAYREHLLGHYGVVFDSLFTLANMPIQRFGSTLVSKGQFDDYMQLLRGAHRDENLEQVMCRSLVSVDWQGYLYDCDFNQQLGLPIHGAGESRIHPGEGESRIHPSEGESRIHPSDDELRIHISQLGRGALDGNPIRIADHCFGCTAGQGSSCGGALADGPEAESRAA